MSQVKNLTPSFTSRLTKQSSAIFDHMKNVLFHYLSTSSVQQIIGCQGCVETWCQKSNMCPLCSVSGATNSFDTLMTGGALETVKLKIESLTQLYFHL